MSDSLKKYSFIELLEGGKLRVPKIQRDYAQGRRAQKIDEIRKVFVHTLMLVVKGKRPSTELDFVYGSNRNHAFEPLDGQQRLTTLFLLHWMMGVNLADAEQKHSLFTYETRNTSTEFCDELVLHVSMQFVEEALKKETKPSEIIRGRDWFKWEWKYDPTVLSMLVMIDAIFNEMTPEGWAADMSVYRSNLNNITFHLLNLGEFGLSDELFIKMNARGKQLSDFDKLKSTLEEELQLQQREKHADGTPLATVEDENRWRTLMDGAWIDFFWHKYARQVIADTNDTPADERKAIRLNSAKESEFQFKKLLLRFIAVQCFEAEHIDSNLRAAAYRNDEGSLDYLLFAYMDSLTNLRSDDDHKLVPAELFTINFQRLVDDVNLLIYRGADGLYHDLSSLLPQTSHIDNDEFSLFDIFLGRRVNNDAQLIFHAYLLFLRAFPPVKTKREDDEVAAFDYDPAAHQVWQKNLEDWVRATRNILLNVNNNQHIDKPNFLIEATNNIVLLAKELADYAEKNVLDVEKNDKVVKHFFAQAVSQYSRLDNRSFDEERDKAIWIMAHPETKWEEAFDAAERHPYLWGQIRCLLNWCEDSFLQFCDYRDRLVALFDYIGSQELKYYTAMLAFRPDSWRANNRLYLNNKTRDNSFKRYLRDRSRADDNYGANIKALLDEWRDNYPCLSIDQFIEALTNECKDECPTWVKGIIAYPTILCEAWEMMIFEHRGHPILAQRRTDYSHCFDPILLYFRKQCEEAKLDPASYEFYDSKAQPAHAFRLEQNGKSYMIGWSADEGNYSLSENEIMIHESITPKEIVEKFNTLLNHNEIAS